MLPKHAAGSWCPPGRTPPSASLCPWLTRAVSPAVPVYNGILFLFVLANFSMATFMDPGVFPRGTRPPSGSHRSPARQVPPSPPGTPRSPSYGGPKAVAFIHTDLPEPPPSLAMQSDRLFGERLGLQQPQGPPGLRE
ncbi:hypothetical protein CB1_000042005 [Camelus ferus]|nr:hypothetical protein CB1_000042005 [Camelus ferus]